MFSLKTWFWTLGLLCLQTFVLCVLWNIFEPRAIYIHMLETFLPGFKWLTLGSFVLGALESFFYGAYVAVAFVLLHNLFHRMHEKESNKGRNDQAAV